VEISSNVNRRINGKRLFRRTSNVILFHRRTMLTAIARKKLTIARLIERGGFGKPSAITAEENNQRGRRLANRALQEPSLASPIPFWGCQDHCVNGKEIK
jgi:hypothetical protein